MYSEFDSYIDDGIGEDREQDTVLDNCFTLFRGKQEARLSVLFILLNLIVVFVRPQNELGFLSIIKFPFLVSLLPSLMWLMYGVRQKWTPQMWVMFLFVVQGALLVPFATNNRMAFEGFRVLFQLFISVSFPIIVFCRDGFTIRRLWKLFLFISIYWAFYSFSHSGRGPGDYLGDENDFGLSMLMMLGLIVGGINIFTKRFYKFLVLCVCVILICGIIATASRGAFVGLMCLFAYLVFKSNRKFLVTVLISIVFVVGLSLAPKEYVDDMRSISNTNQGTAKERREYWKVAWLVFTDFNHIIWGVGMKNLPSRTNEYEPDENYAPTGRSISGRAAHSLYFTLLPELGLIGLVLFLCMLWHSFMPNSRYKKNLNVLLTELESLHDSVTTADELRKRRVYEKTRLPALADDYFEVIEKLRVEIKMLSMLFLGINAAWIGVLTSGAFITVLYYPPIWLLAALSASAQAYFVKINRFITECEIEVQSVAGLVDDKDS